eukprot:TRINITY_DN758_c0_g1_i1.p1 TRINITY_DN758_c0_g1~~TRINITY_DN758_c0_g1_i1.p1  ORF type:complete len:516 (-),score=109.83 TRINITY_DN758_c0_g1_i1:142-1689(-)
MADINESVVETLQEPINETQEQETVVEKKEVEKIFCGLIGISPMIRPRHFYAAIGHWIALGIVFGSVDTLFTMLLTSKDYYNVPQSSIGTTQALIVGVEMVARFLVVTPLGVMYDHYGRKKPLIISYIFSIIFFGAIPYAGNVVPELLIVRILYGIATTSILLVPLIADYIHDDWKGRGSGAASLILLTGALLGSILLKTLLAYKLTLGQIGLVLTGVLGFGCLSSCFIKGGVLKKKSESHNVAVPQQKTSFWESLLIGFKAAINIPWIGIAFIATFLSGGEIHLMAGILVMWATSYYGESDEGKEKANNVAAKLGVYISMANLVMTLLMTVIVDKVNKFGIIIPAFVLIFFGYGSIVLAGDPDSTLTSLAALALGIGFGSLLVTTFLVNKYSPVLHRGKVSGSQSILRILGVVASNIIGGWLFEVWRSDAPYLMFTAFAAIANILIFALFVTSKKWAKRVENDLKNQLNDAVIEEDESEKQSMDNSEIDKNGDVSINKNGDEKDHDPRVVVYSK